MTAYEVYLVMHVVGALFWVGAALVLVIFAGRVAAAGAPERMLQLARDAEWFGLRVFLPANLLVVVSGFLLVWDGSWGFGPLWIRLGLAGFALSFLVGAAVFGPQWPRLVQAAEADGMASPDAERRLWRLLFVSGIDLGVLLGVVVAMTLKPTAGDGTMLAVVAALPVLGAVLGAAVARLATTRIRAAPAVGVP